MSYCQWFYRIEQQDPEGWERPLLDLAQISKAGVPMPPGFVISREVSEHFFGSRSVRAEINKAAYGITLKDASHFSAVAEQARKAIRAAKFSAGVHSALHIYLEELQTRLLKKKGSSMRLMLTAYAEQQVTIIQNVKNSEEFEKALKQLFSLLFTERDVYQRAEEGKPMVPDSFSISVLYAPEPQFSGYARSYDEQGHDDTIIEIKATHSVGASNAEIQNLDSYRIDKKSGLMLTKNLQRHWWAESENGRFVSPSHLGKTSPFISDDQVLNLGKLLKQAFAQFPDRVQCGWMFAGNQFLITSVARGDSGKRLSIPQDEEKPLLHGLSGSLGFVSGPVRLIAHKKDQAALKTGEIAVVSHLSEKDWEWLIPAAAIIAEAGTSTGAEARLAKRLAVPAVVGASKALTTLKNGQMVTVDGRHGLIYAGIKHNQAGPIHSAAPITGTKLWATIHDPYRVSAADLAASDGVGILRGEFIIRLLGVHPQDVLKKELAREYSELLAEGIAKVVHQAEGHPVIYQLHDIGSMDLLGLRSRHHDRHEPNPALGYRGTHRLLSEPEVLDMELVALAAVARQFGAPVSVMLPMVRTLEEAKRMLAYLADSPLAREVHIPVWIKCETPGMVILMDELCQMDIAGVCFDIPSISQFIQGIDKENYQIAHHVNSTDAAVEQALSYAIQTCRAEGVASMIVAEQEEMRPEMVQSAIEAGVTGLSVAPSQLEDTRGLVAAIEQRLLLDHVLDERRELPAA